MTAPYTELLENIDTVAPSPVPPPAGRQRISRRRTAGVVLLLLLLAAVTVGAVCTGALHKKQRALSDTVASQAAENEALREQNAGLAAELDTQKSQNAALAEQNALLKSQVASKYAQSRSRPLTVAVDGSAKLVALTFDDGPGQYTAELLDYLKAHHVRATFFLIGRNAARYPSLIKRMDAEGHAIGNHTQNHARLTRLSADGIRKEIADCDAVIRAAVGYAPALLRTPGGNADDAVKSIARDMELPIARWSVDTRDWSTRSAEKTVAAALDPKSGVKDGSIVLMHDIYRSTVDAVKQIVPRLEAQGYTFVTVPELLAARCGGATAGDTYYNAYPRS